VLVLQGIAFVLILASEALRDVDWPRALQRLSQLAPKEPIAEATTHGEKTA